MNKLLKDPLVHFLVAGAVLFAVYGVLNRGEGGGEGDSVVRVTAQQVEWLTETWMRQWQRPPTEDELRGLLKEYLKETMLAREAQELGLDADDTVVRRRLAQKMNFLMEDFSAREPTEEELRRTYEDNRERFQSPARVSFTHIYFSTDRRGALATADATAVLEDLTTAGGSGGTPELGDRFLLESEHVDQEEQAVAGLFGTEFSRAVFALEPGDWHGPIESGYGVHLVRVTARHDARVLEFEVVREEVTNYWLTQYQDQRNEAYTAALFEKYEIVADDDIKPLLDPLVGTGGGQ
jgi:parvulin-like peptidyl-prolyl isomerase